MHANGTAHIGNEDKEGFWAEGEAARFEVQRTDENEIRIGVERHDSDTDDATLYLTLGEASRLAHILGIAVLAHEAAAHEATKYAQTPP